MGRVTVKRLRHVAGRYFWRPTPAVKRLGFAAEALGSDLAQAVARAQKLNALVEQTVAGTDPPKETAAEPYSVAALVELYRQDEEFTNLRPKTQAGYNSILRKIVSIAGRIAVASITRKDAREMYLRLKTERGLSTAAAHMRVWRILGQLAVNESWREDNPFAKLKIKSPKPRRQVWEEAEVTAFCKAAIEMGLPSMAIAVQLGLHLGQRLGDILRLSWRAWEGDCFFIVQSKTGARLRVPANAELLDLIARLPRTSTQLVVSETTGRPYRVDHFSHLFAEVRDRAGIRPDVQYRDLRRTAVVRLARSECTVPEIAAITGHTLASAQQILETYLPPDLEVARGAIAKLDRARKRNEVAKTTDQDRR